MTGFNTQLIFKMSLNVINTPKLIGPLNADEGKQSLLLTSIFVNTCFTYTVLYVMSICGNLHSNHL